MKREDSDVTKRSYKIFISGELLNLCIPSEEAINLDGWTDWFNNLNRLTHTGHGLFPNFPEDQQSILNGIKNKEKIALLMCDKVYNRAFGIVSLQQINFGARSAEIAIMMGDPELTSMPSLAALEAMALITEHGFDVIGLDRIYAGQAYPGLHGWNKMLELLAFKVEGITRRTFRRGHDYSDTVLIACTYDDFLALKNKRGNFWHGVKEMTKLIRIQPKDSFAEKVDAKIKELEEEHFKFLAK